MKKQTKNAVQPSKKKRIPKPVKIIYAIQAIISVTSLIFIISSKWYVFATVQGSSMNPTFEDGQRLYVERTIYPIEEYQRGDILIFKSEEIGSDIIKRVIGLPGETVQIKYIRHLELDYYEEEVWINGALLEEPYITKRRLVKPLEWQTFEVPEGHFFILGDNRPNSMDSRLLKNPYLPLEDVIGRIVYVFPELFPSK